MTTAPHECTPGQLRRAGVRVVGREPLKLKCERCAAVWLVPRLGLRLPKGYWKCPNRCNAAS